MILNVTTGSALNYRVVGGTTEPENQIDNTIWVPTDVDIPKHEFSVSDLHTGYKDTDLLEGKKLANGYLDSAGAVVEPDADTPQVYTEAYIPVTSEKTYTFNYEVSETKILWLAVAEYKENNVFSKRVVLVDKVSAKEKTGDYTPSGKDVVAVRLTWRTFQNVETTATFVEPDAKYTIEEPEEGTVWFQIGTQSPTTFNALRKNVLMVSPLAAKQYVGGQWVAVEAKTYQGGQWVEWIVYYYNAGDECTDLTGGWESQAFRPAATAASTRRAGKPTVTKGDTSITLVGKAMEWDSSLSSNVRYAGGLFTGAAVDLTGVDTLHLNVRTYRFEGSTSDLIGCFFGVTAEAKDYYTPAAQVRIEGTGLIDLDVSELTGAYYLYVSISYPGATAPTIGFSEVYS